MNRFNCVMQTGRRFEIILGLLLITFILTGCKSNDDSIAMDVDNTALVNSGLFSIHVTPNPMNPDSRLRIALEVGKDISGRLLLIDMQGEILHRFYEGEFAEGTYQYNYTPETALPPGNYFVVLVDNSNLILERHDVVSTENVLGDQ